MNCQGAWCGKCYRSGEEGKYPIVRPQEEEGFDLTLDVDKSRFVWARDGDNLMIYLQCDLCQLKVDGSNTESRGC